MYVNALYLNIMLEENKIILAINIHVIEYPDYKL